LLPLWSRGFPTAVSELPGAEAAGLDALAGLVARAAEEIPEEASEVAAVGSWEASLLGALETLAVLRGSLDDLATDRFVERLRHLWLGEVGESARFLGAFRAANLERFFRELADRLAEGADPESVLRRLREEVAGAHEVENATASGLERDAVQVMSIHGAKGLTFDHVYLVQLHKSPGGGARPELEWSRHDERCEYSLFGQSTLGQATARDRAADVARAEQVRTLYVAMTRPRVRLVLSGCWKESPDPVDPGSAPHLLSLLASRADGVADLPAMAERVVRRADPEIDGEQAVGVRWRFPAVFADPPAPAGRPGTSDLGPRATRSIERFAVERPSALARQRRPFSGRATGGSDSPDPDSSRESRAPSESDGAGTVESPRRDRAMAVGTAIHALLEEWDTGAEPGSELERRRSRLGSQLGGLVPPGELAAAVEEAEELLQAFADRGALARLHAIGDGIVARELPILRPPGSDGGAVLFESGIIDLVYRDPSTGELVIADYKTDRVSDRAECEAKAKQYEEQGRFYVETLQAALGLADEPRFELWFLRVGEVVSA
jgi:ATP-dependent exoDNAse (exonuclease V) beta subunit